MFKKKVALALAVAMVAGSISGCGGFLKVSVGGKDIVNIGEAESTEKETEAMLASEESKEEHAKKEIKAQITADAEAWDKAKKTTFSGSGIRLTLPGETPDTFVETTHMDQDSMFISNTATAAMMLTFLTPVFKSLPPSGKGRVALTMAPFSNR